MNSTLKELYERKSVRVYEDKEISYENKEAIIKAAMEAPTAGNLMLYSIINVTDQAIKERLAVSCDNQPFIAKAPMVLIFLADYQRWYDAYSLCVDEVRKPMEGDLLLACEDALIAAQNSVVAAESLGIGSCYIGDILENYEIHKEILGLPDYVLPIGMLCFGYGNENQMLRNKPKRFEKEFIVFENKYKSHNEEEYNMMFQKWREDNGAQYRGLKEEVQAIYNRKYGSEFSMEMSRSVREYLKYWGK